MRPRAPGNTRMVRSYNAAVVLQALHRAGSASRSRLGEETGMSPATISRITAQLIQQGIVVEERLGASTGGRPPVILRIDYEKLHVIGVRLLKDQVSLGVFDLKGRPLRKTSYVPVGLDADFFIRELHGRVEDLLAGAGLRIGAHVLGAGLAVAGVVRGEDGVVVRSVNLGWQDVALASRTERLLGIPVFVENDANAGALAEVWFGGGTGTDYVMYVKTDTGVGAGVVVGEDLLAGPRGMAGEFGHVPVVPGGRECRCGQRGCLETYVYIPDVLERYNAHTGRRLDKEAFFTRAAAGDATAGHIVAEAKVALTRALTSAAALLDLDKVIIDGMWGRFSPEFLHEIEMEVRDTLRRTGLDKKFSVTSSGLGVDGDLLGAVGLVSQRLFSPPDVLSGTEHGPPLTDQLTASRG